MNRMTPPFQVLSRHILCFLYSLYVCNDGCLVFFSKCGEGGGVRAHRKKAFIALKFHHGVKDGAERIPSNQSQVTVSIINHLLFPAMRMLNQEAVVQVPQINHGDPSVKVDRSPLAPL